MVSKTYIPDSCDRIDSSDSGDKKNLHQYSFSQKTFFTQKILSPNNLFHQKKPFTK